MSKREKIKSYLELENEKMNNKIKCQISTGPMEKDWLVAELLYGDEHLGDIGEWGNRIFLYPRENGEPWNFMVDDFVEAIRLAREQVSTFSKDQINKRES